MTVQLNIKSAKVRELALQLSARTGESLTETIARALRERLERLEKPSKEELIRKWNAISEDNARRYPDGLTSETMDDWLYDPETGLPRDDR